MSKFKNTPYIVRFGDSEINHYSVLTTYPEGALSNPNIIHYNQDTLCGLQVFTDNDEKDTVKKLSDRISIWTFDPDEVLVKESDEYEGLSVVDFTDCVSCLMHLSGEGSPPGAGSWEDFEWSPMNGFRRGNLSIWNADYKGKRSEHTYDKEVIKRIRLRHKIFQEIIDKGYKIEWFDSNGKMQSDKAICFKSIEFSPRIDTSTDFVVVSGLSRIKGAVTVRRMDVDSVMKVASYIIRDRARGWLEDASITTVAEMINPTQYGRIFYGM